MKKEEQKIGFNVFHWGPCVVHTKIPSEAIELFLKEAEASNEDAASALAGVLNKEVYLRDKDKFKIFFEKFFSLRLLLYRRMAIAIKDPATASTGRSCSWHLERC